jgi:hypothetical protein
VRVVSELPTGSGLLRHPQGWGCLKTNPVFTTCSSWITEPRHGTRSRFDIGGEPLEVHRFRGFFHLPASGLGASAAVAFAGLFPKHVSSQDLRSRRVDLERARRYGAGRSIGPPQLFALCIPVKFLARPGRCKRLSAPSQRPGDRGQFGNYPGLPQNLTSTKAWSSAITREISLACWSPGASHRGRGIESAAN